MGYQVVVGLDMQEGDRVVFFEAGGQLSADFCKYNNLNRDSELNQDTTKTGLMDKNRKVRSIRLRGEVSEGYLVPVSFFSYLPYKFTEEDGFEFTELNGEEVCRKYETERQKRQREQGAIGRKVKRGETEMFRKHFDTSKWKQESYRINSPGMVYITEKLHGTSARLGLCLEEIPLYTTKKGVSRWFLKAFRPKLTTKVWKYLHGSRQVIINDGEDESRVRNSFYGTDAFRYKAVEGITLHKGEILYGEIVGYVSEDTRIMADQHVKVIASEPDYLAQKDLSPEDSFKYTYGCRPGECKFYVYRIVQVNEDGNKVELSWPQVKARCEQLGISAVPELATYYYDGSEEATQSLHSLVSSMTDGGHYFYSTLDKTHIKEGIIIRFAPDSGGSDVVLKSKAWLFLTLEHGLRDLPDFVDMEEVS